MKQSDPNRGMRIFELWFLPWMRTRVRAVRMAGARRLDEDRPLVMVANHISWWDGFIMRAVQRAVRPYSPFSVIMDREHYERFRFFEWIGAVPIEPGSASSTMSTIAELRRRASVRPDLTVTFFPQGRIWPSTRRPLGFGRGVELFIRRLGADVLPVGIHLEPLNRVSPTCFVSVGAPLVGAPSVDRVEEAVTEEVDAILQHLALHGESAEQHWPERDERLARPSVASQPAT